MTANLISAVNHNFLRNLNIVRLFLFHASEDATGTAFLCDGGGAVFGGIIAKEFIELFSFADATIIFAKAVQIKSLVFGSMRPPEARHCESVFCASKLYPVISDSVVVNWLIVDEFCP